MPLRRFQPGNIATKPHGLRNIPFGNRASGSGGGIDPDAQAFITAAGITDPTQKTAINDLVLGLKADSLWTKMIAIYPLVGGTAATHKWNLINPTDSDAAHRATFGGGLTHSATGILPNGSTGYMNTHVVPSTDMTNNDTHWSFYSGTDTITGAVFDIGAVSGAVTIHYILRTNLLGGSQILSDSYGGIYRLSPTVANSLGFFTDSVPDASHHSAFQDGVSLASNLAENDVTNVTVPITVFARNNGGTIQDFSNRECRFASFGSGLTDTDVANLYTHVQAYQTALSRNV